MKYLLVLLPLVLFGCGTEPLAPCPATPPSTITIVSPPPIPSPATSPYLIGTVCTKGKHITFSAVTMEVRRISDKCFAIISNPHSVGSGKL